jgi:hypothetical protein
MSVSVDGFIEGPHRELAETRTFTNGVVLLRYGVMA